MRVDQKMEGPRQSMSWLHTWASLILGWLLYAIFVTGTLSFFQNEISTWMKPETH
ncbi:MAG: PepSY-associated TM helix domain-containing protein, partial [Proteobacteria bacterium]|nr:PepSY-associated TM helix domain-containing protein [Pseudomonadota bacterium]